MKKAGSFSPRLLCVALQLSAATALAQDTALPLEEKALFDWAEYAYPKFFSPAGPPTRQINGYLARYYSGTYSYLGLRDRNVYAVGDAFRNFPVTEGSVRLLGPYSRYAPTMNADGFGVVTGEKLLLSEAVSSDPAGRGDWFELYNAGSVPVALGAYQVRDENADKPLRNLPARTLAPGEYTVIMASETAAPGAAFTVPFNLGDSDKVQLFRNGTLVDELAWDDSEAKHGYGFSRYPGPLSKPRTILSTLGGTNKPEAGWGRNALGSVGSLHGGRIHDITLQIDQAAFEAMVENYRETGDKDWIESTVIIDGVEYKEAGIRLKGNSSLCEVTTNPNPSTAPLLVKLNKYVPKQNHEGLQEFVVRSNPNKTALNEAVALELLEQAGLATQDAVGTRFKVNGAAPVLRLVIESPDGEWMAEEFAKSGALYKAEAGGDYSYRGEDPALYDEVFDQEAGDANADLKPLIAFLKFINQSDDATFKASLPAQLNVDAFAVYLAMQELLKNFDDIDGPGNNSYLYYDTGKQQFTIVPWDYNLAFGGLELTGPDGEIPPGGALPPGGTLPPGGVGPGPGGDDQGNFAGCVRVIDRGPGPDGPGAVPPPGGLLPGPDTGGPIIRGPIGPGGESRNILVKRFLAVPEWKALYEQKQQLLRNRLYANGIAEQLLELWSAVIGESGLVDGATLTEEAADVSREFN